ncbi:glutathione ABC transporter substrate-binding protein [Alkalihalophilus lindianensis]|uniref:Glutathione ABC transporter substrate-binding protein n=1 Tax=Alkalihalophilus lindianensis TaxID=1630542 RepID=A0ABU3X5Z0_9BACI|nr:glutathione ABC transporter substrate-binding protein [Alkalihalophilus lindianensis]MDV2683305.1 glutathione ABC transporter substrate-binding protein [Alkalihalophilus lindianensis]
MSKYSVWLIFVMVSALFAACSSNDSVEDNGSQGTERSGGDLTIDVQADPQTLDPHLGNDHQTLNVGRTIYDTLVYTDQELNIHMGLAESFEPIDDTTWEIKLRGDVVFHDGSQLNGEVIKVNVERILDADIASPVSFLYDMITDIEVVDEYTVQIETEYPFAPLPAHFAHPGGHIISSEAIAADYEAMEGGEEPGSVINAQPVGSGYFKFEDRVHGQSVKVVKNDEYWGEKAKVDSITFKVVPEDLTRVAELETNSAQIIGHLNPSDVTRVEETDGVKVSRQDSVSLAYLGFNNTKEPFTDQRVRQAISMAIDKEQIIDGIMDGAALPAKGPLAPPVFGYSEEVDGISYDVEESKELLVEAGFAEGFETTIWTDDARIRIDVAEYLQNQLAEIGIKAEIRSMEYGAFLDSITNAEHDLMIGAWGTVTADADYGLYPMFHSSNFGMTGNRTFYSNDEVDELLILGRQETDEQARLEIYKKAQEIIIDEAPLVPLYHTEHLAGLREDVEGFWIHPSSLYFLRDVSVP